MRNIAKLIFLISFLLTAAFTMALEGHSPSIKASINRKRIFIGDRIRYKVEAIPGLAAFEVKFPQFNGGLIGDCEIKDSGDRWLDMTSYYVGKRKIPSIEIKYRPKSEMNWKAGLTNELAFTVESVLPKGARLYDIKDIKGPLYPFSLSKLIMRIIVSFIILWILIKILKMFRKKPPLKLPYETALDELKAAIGQFSSGGGKKEYYVRISDTIRRYIEMVFSLRATEMTTQEFLMSLNNAPELSSGYKDSLKVFMEACDLVKFARHTPSAAEIDSVLTAAKKFIEETKEAYVHI